MLTLDLFNGVSDPRRAQGRRYEFAPLMTAIVLAVLAGATSFRKMAAFMELQREHLNALLGTAWTDAPTYGTLRYLMQSVKDSDLESVLRQQGKRLAEAENEAGPGRRLLAIDGKALRGSAQRLEEVRAQQLLSVFGHQDRIVLGHGHVAEKTNEIPVAQDLIRELGLSDYCLFTLDALHCQKNPGTRPTTRGRGVGPGQS